MFIMSSLKPLPLLAFALLSQIASAQIRVNHYDPGIVSPNVASFMEYGKVPVSLSNGSADVTIPLHELEYRGIKVPIALAYNTSGNRVENHPSQVGLGWNLLAGGVITGFGGGIASPGDAWVLRYNDIKSELGRPDWLTATYLSDVAKSLTPLGFTFNFLGMTGTFYLDHTGAWRVQSKENPGWKIEHFIVDNVTVANPTSSSNVPRMFWKFILTSIDGTKYVFGGTPNSIEYVRGAIIADASWDEQLNSSAWYLTEIISPKGTITFTYEREFSFEQTVYSEINNTGAMRSPDEAEESNANEVNAVHPYLIHHSNLTEINAGNDIKISIARSEANELKYKLRPLAWRMITFWGQNGSFDYTHVFTHLPSTNVNYTLSDMSDPSVQAINRSSKIDEIKVFNKTQAVVKKISLSYIEQPTQRLKLSAVAIGSATEINQRYTFNYNSQLLPDYNTGFEDHWGFYNGKNYAWVAPGLGYPQPIPDAVAYYNSREPDAAYMQAEMLTKITYPTGGTSELIYEPNDYSNVVKNYPIALEPVSNNPIGGGLRIRKIINIDPVSNTSTAREFFYRTNYLNGGTVSSGVAPGKPVYHVSGTSINYDFTEFSSEAFLRFGKVGFIYSEVTEKTPEGGYTVYKYSSYDNGYMNKPPLAMNGTPSGHLHYSAFADLAIERGLLLEKTLYKDDGLTPVQNQKLDYNDDSLRYEDYVRAYEWRIPIPGSNWGSVTARLPYYTFTPYLKKRTTTDYFAGGGSVSNSVNYVYANPVHRQLTRETRANSVGDTIIRVYKYPHDFASEQPYTNMVNVKHMWSPVIEEITYKNDTSSFLSSVKTDYSFWNSGSPTTSVTDQILTQKVSVKNRATDYEPRINYLSYDAISNVISAAKESGSPDSYIWGYNKQYPIAEAKNASYTEIYHENFEEGSVFPLLVADATRTHTGLYSGRMDNTSGGIQVSHSPVWINVPAGTGRKIRYSAWVYSNGPSVNIFLFMKKAGESGYFTNVTLAGTTEINKWVLVEGLADVPDDIVIASLRLDNNSNGTVWYDDLRIHPQGAQMSTYTYQPLVGMTSATDVRNNTTYYEYDAAGRLIAVRDRDRNLLKAYDYHYKP